MKTIIKKALAFVGVGIYKIEKENFQISSVNETEAITTSINENSVKVEFRKNGSDKNVFDQILVEEEYRNIVEVLLQLDNIGQSWNIVDAGANIGLTALYLANHLPNSNIVCIEPDDDNVEMIRRNLNANNLNSRVKIVLGGLWSKANYLTTRRDFRDGKDWAITVIETDDKENSIQGFGLPDIIDKYFPNEIIHLLKLDIEGAEAEVFRSIQNENILNQVLVIAVEIHDEFDCRNQIYETLSKQGFVYFNTGELTVGINKKMGLC